MHMYMAGSLGTGAGPILFTFCLPVPSKVPEQALKQLLKESGKPLRISVNLGTLHPTPGL